MKQGIRNIIFDLGNVLLDLDFERVNERFEELLGADFHRLAASEATKDIFLKFETGYFSEESFINALQRLTSKVPDGRKVIEAWNSLLVGIPAERLEMLTALKVKGYQLYLLSNTNSLHVQWLNLYLRKEYGVEDFAGQFFEKVYYSHLLKMRKPDPEIYEFVLQDAFVQASSTLFVDDNEENVKMAQKLGITTIHHRPTLEITEVIQGFLE